MSIVSRSKFRAGFVAAVFAVATLSPICHAQDVGTLVEINVPFAFETASGQQFNPGVYILRAENVHTLLIQGPSKAGFVATSVVDNGQPAKACKATFLKYGNQYVLGEISFEGNSRRLELISSKMANRLQIATGKAAPTQVELALLGTPR